MGTDEATLTALLRHDRRRAGLGAGALGAAEEPIRRSPSCGSISTDAAAGIDRRRRRGAAVERELPAQQRRPGDRLADRRRDDRSDHHGRKVPGGRCEVIRFQRTRGRGAEGAALDRRGHAGGADGRDRGRGQALRPHAGARRRELCGRAQRAVRAARAERRRQDDAAAHPLHHPAARQRQRAHQRRRRGHAVRSTRGAISASCSRSRASTTG